VMDYQEFLRNKIILDSRSGFEIDDSDISPILFPHQRYIVKWAVSGGRRAIFAAFGLGKSLMQLETMRQIGNREGGKLLIVAPLGVRQEFKRDAGLLGMETTFVRWTADLAGDGLYITNYESIRDGRLDPNQFTAVSLDEASVLRSFGSKTYQEFLTLFGGVKYRFVATATPSPNRHKELIHYAGFLGIMDTGQALTRFFQRDSQKAGNLTLYPHKEQEFWYWVNSWAVFLQRPSDLGYSDEGYSLPKLHIHYHEVETDLSFRKERNGQMNMFNDAGLSLQDASREKRRSLDARIEKIEEIINATCRQRETVGFPQGVLQKSPGENARKPEAERFWEEGRYPGVSEKLLRSEQRTALGETEGFELENLQEKHGQTLSANEDNQLEEVWVNSRDVRGYPSETERGMCDLRGRERGDGTILSPCGPLPRDRQGAGVAMPSMQCWPGEFQGQHIPSHESEGLSDQIVIWCDLNSEQKSIEKTLKSNGISFISLYGNTDVDSREGELDMWKNKSKTAFISKPSMYGSGVNMQQCHTMVFSGIGFKFNSFIQAIHRIFRFQQEQECHIHIIYTDTEKRVLQILQEKWRLHDIMVEKMSDIIKKHGLSVLQMANEMLRSLGCERVEVNGKNYTAVNNDCVNETRRMADNSIGLIHTSIPFSNHYEYSPSYNDFGHNTDNDTFFEQMDFLTPELLRVLKPGRVFACHVKDRIQFGNVTGYGMPSVDPFHVTCINHYRQHGFIYIGMITVVTDVVRENNQTYRLGWTEQCKDGSKMGVGCPEYILLFRKLPSDNSKAYSDERVVKDKQSYSRSRWQIDAHAFWRSSGDRLLSVEELTKYPVKTIGKLFKKYLSEGIYDYETHVKIGEELDIKGALPSTFMLLDPPSNDPEVWHDVCRMRTLNGNQKQRGLNNHICPLQIDIVDRIITRYSNEGDVVYDPFGGLMTVPYRAVIKKRYGIGCELNPEYFADGLSYLNQADKAVQMPTLFDCEIESSEAAA